MGNYIELYVAHVNERSDLAGANEQKEWTLPASF